MSRSCYAAVGCPPKCSVKAAVVFMMIRASRVRPSASRTAVARENIPTRLRGGFPAIASLHPTDTGAHLPPTRGNAQEASKAGLGCDFYFSSTTSWNRVERRPLWREPSVVSTMSKRNQGLDRDTRAALRGLAAAALPSLLAVAIVVITLAVLL
jgi:hypothetical protein